MLEKIESFLLNKFLGKVCSRLAVTIVSALAAAPVQALILKADVWLAYVGIHVHIDPINQVELTAAMIAAGQAAFEYFKKRRMANPLSPAVQTDPKLIASVPPAPLV